MISVDREKCLGCKACSNVCPNHFITREDGRQRTINFSKCSEECDLCVEFCPGKALSLVPECPETTLVFDLVPCTICGTGFATENMLKRVASSVPLHLQVDDSGQSWIQICPSCRQDLERERMARQILLRRK